MWRTRVSLCLPLLAWCTACGGGSEPKPGERSVLENPPEEFLESCRRHCALLERLKLPCEPGEAIRHGVRIGSGEVPANAPVSDDPECMATCTEPPPNAECWRQLGAAYDCDADATWICDFDGGWHSNQCVDVLADRAVCWDG